MQLINKYKIIDFQYSINYWLDHSMQYNTLVLYYVPL